MRIKAIETYYNGYRFRSRLEARWAVFLDALSIEYEYEPEGFELPSGKRYLPDFKVRCYGTRGGLHDKSFDLFIEVKGEMTKDDADRIKEFCGYGWDDINDWPTIENPLLVVGNIPKQGYCYNLEEEGIDGVYTFNYSTIDGDCFGAYPAAHDGKFYLWGADSSYINSCDVEGVEHAYDLARQARFEYGETPTKEDIA